MASGAKTLVMLALVALLVIDQGSAAYNRDPLPFNGNFLGKRGGPGFDLAYLPKSGYFIGKRSATNFANYLLGENTKRAMCEEAVATCTAWFGTPSDSSTGKGEV